MYCPRLDHFVRINFNGTISRCGHMIDAPQFQSFTDMEASDWMIKIKNTMADGHWPKECNRCQAVEQLKHKSIRQHSLDNHATLSDVKLDYLILGGVLDNVCNSACQTCSETYSTKIGSLRSKQYIKINNAELIDTIPTERIVQLDINGGEPSASVSYIRLLENLPPNVKYLRVNTNGSRLIKILPTLIARDVKVIVTVSLDGIGKIHDYIRWPIKWQDVEQNILAYQSMGLQEVNTWTTVSALNIGILKQIIAYVETHSIKHSWALLENPSVLNVRFSNYLTKHADIPSQLKSIVATSNDNTAELQQWITSQDQLRGIRMLDYYK